MSTRTLETPVIADRRDFRLAKTVRPRRYELRFDLDLNEWRSTGHERIALQIEEPTREIVLHALDLDIQSATIAGGPTFESATYDAEAQIATLRFTAEIGPGAHTLDIDWTGGIRDAL